MMQEKKWKKRREDYALAVVPEEFRTWRWYSLTSVMFSAVTAMVFLALGGQMAQIYGTKDTLIALGLGAFGIGTVGFILAMIASDVGLDMDLITSGSGFGYKGAGLTSLIYGVALIIFFAMEGSIIAHAMHSYFAKMPLWSIYTLVGLIFIPLVWYGITQISVVMWITVPMYFILLVWAIVKATHVGHPVHFLSYKGSGQFNPKAGPALLQLGAMIPAFISNAAAAADIGRFIPKKHRLVSALCLGYLTNFLALFVAGGLGAWLSLRLGQTDPGAYFPVLLGGWGALFVFISQLRVNLLNNYLGSLAFSTFFSRVFNVSPGRQYWIILVAIAATFMMYANILGQMTHVLTFISVFLVAWVMSVVSYMLFNRYWFKLSPRNFPYKKGDIPEFDPIGVTALLLSLAVSVPMTFGAFGLLWESLSPFVAAVLAFVIVPIMTLVEYRRGSMKGVSTEV